MVVASKINYPKGDGKLKMGFHVKEKNKYLLLKVTVIDGQRSIWKVVHFLLAPPAQQAALVKSRCDDG